MDSVECLLGPILGLWETVVAPADGFVYQLYAKDNVRVLGLPIVCSNVAETLLGVLEVLVLLPLDCTHMSTGVPAVLAPWRAMKIDKDDNAIRASPANSLLEIRVGALKVGSLDDRIEGPIANGYAETG